MQKQPFILTRYTGIIWQIVILLLVICGFYFSSLYSYILFHSLIEMFSIIIASVIFILAFNTRRFLDNNYFLLIGIAFLFIAIIDIFHTLAYKGMGIFQGYDANLPTQLWIAMRYMLAISFLIAPLTINRKWRAAPIFAAYTVVTILLTLSIFYWQVFPDCFIEGQGLTSFKIVSEYIISAILLSSLILLLYRRKYFDGNVLLLLCISIAMSIAGEFAFTTYASVFGISNFIGHILVFISFYLIYKALIETGLNKPYDLLFRDLKRSEEELRTLSMIDALTGLYNRRGFLDVAEKQLKISNRLKTEALVFYIDLDGMKWINDKLGHKEGDVALARTAGILKDTFRESDFIGRIGGDEFVILATATHQNYVNVIIKRLKERLDIHNARVKQQYKLSLSMGMASYDPEHHRLIGELIEQADKAMYLQKNAKGNNRK